MKSIVFILSFLFLTACIELCGQVRLPSLVSEGMVLQRETKTRIWGWARAGEEIRVTFRNQDYQTKAGPDGRWALFLNPEKAGGPYEMQISASNHIQLKNILIGEVWVCSGQSNMVLPMERVKEKYPAEIARSANDLIRQFFVPVRYDFSGELDNLPPGAWTAANPENVLSFTATGYFFARKMFEKYKVPIGLINVSAGGSPVEAWLDEVTLREFPVAFAELKKFQDTSYVNALRRQEAKVSNQWFKNLYQLDKGKQERLPWSDQAYDASGWEKIQLPSLFNLDDGKGNKNGVVWLKKQVTIPAELAGKPAKLFLGRIVDSDSVYVNGVFTGTISYQYPPRRYTIKPGVLKAGQNNITIRVISSSGQGGFIREKPYEIHVGDRIIDLKGEWQVRTGAVTGLLTPSTFFQAKPAGLFNGMLSPVIPYTIKGVIWYQGESNVDDPAGYELRFSKMIALWRERWQQGDFPFLFVQLANYLEPSTRPSESNWAEIRDAQRLSLKNVNTGMASAVDLGEWNDLHPLNKKAVGERLALSAFVTAYAEQGLTGSGPLINSWTMKKGKVSLLFSNTGKGLMLSKGKTPSHFALAGADGKFEWARARIKGHSVEVWSDKIKEPVMLRYAWADNPETANLYNQEGLPASPFRIFLK